MAYTKFQFIALETPTSDPVTPADMWVKDKDYVSAVAQALSEEEKKAVAKLGADAKNRLNWIREAVAEALLSEHLDKSSGTLKIFAAPEFFFRPDLTNNQQGGQGVPNRAYSFNDARAIELLFEHLFRDEALKDWLIIPGTMLGQMGLEKNARTPNQAYVIKGGKPENKKTAILTRHAKFNTPDTDKIPKLRLWPVPPKGKERTALWNDQANTLNLNTTNIITVGGVPIGIDLCMDHGCGILYRTCKLKEEKGLLLQVLIACGHPVKIQSLATVNGGFILRMEGARLDPHSQVLKVTKVDWEDPDFSDHEPDLKQKKQYLESDASKRGFQPTIKVKSVNLEYDEYLRFYQAESFPKQQE